MSKGSNRPASIKRTVSLRGVSRTRSPCADAISMIGSMSAGRPYRSDREDGFSPACDRAFDQAWINIVASNVLPRTGVAPVIVTASQVAI